MKYSRTSQEMSEFNVDSLGNIIPRCIDLHMCRCGAARQGFLLGLMHVGKNETPFHAACNHEAQNHIRCSRHGSL